MEPSSTSDEPTPLQGEGSSNDLANLSKIQALLETKDDTRTFAGLALLKTLLDNSSQLREDHDTIRSLWKSISPKFLKRLIRTGCSASNKDGKDMLDLAVSVMHTFSVLLPTDALAEPKFTSCIPVLIQAVLHSSDETTELLLQLLYTLSSTPQGAEAILQTEDLSPLTEVAHTNSKALEILSFSFLHSMEGSGSKDVLATRVNETIQGLVSSFRDTDAVTLLEFLGYFLRHANTSILPRKPKWLGTVVGYIQNLVRSRPTPEARSAYTTAAASLLQAYPEDAPTLLFTDRKDAEKPFGYLLINLLLIDIRSSAATLLSELNSENYPKTSQRLASAFDVVCIFIGFLVRSLEDESLDSLVMSPDNLLKLRQTISETMSVTIEYLRDRWDASVAGAMGLHPEARSADAVTSMGSRQTLAWDSASDNAEGDPFILSAIRALALWLREDENDSLRKEASGLTDMFMDLYTSSQKTGQLDFRSPILVALEALASIKRGREILLQNDGWKILTLDLTRTVQEVPLREDDASRGTDTVRVLLPVIELAKGGTSQEWLDLVTIVAGWDLPDASASPTVLEFEVSVLQLCCVILINTSPVARQRYIHTTSSLAGLATQLQKVVGKDDPLQEQMEDVLGMLASIR